MSAAAARFAAEVARGFVSESHRKLVATLVGLALFTVVATGLLAERALRADLVPADLAPLLSSLRAAWLAAAAIASPSRC